MKKRIIITLFCQIVFVVNNYAQQSDNSSRQRKRYTLNSKENVKIDSTKNDGKIIDDKAFVNVVKNDLSFLTTGNSNSSLYNQIFLEIIEPKIQVNVQAFEIFNKTKVINRFGQPIYLDKSGNETTNKSLKDKNKKEDRTPMIRLNLSVVAGIKNNISSLFSNDKINPNVGISGQMNFDLVRILNRKYGYYYLPEDSVKFLLKEQSFQKNLNLQRDILKNKDTLNNRNIDWIDKKIKYIDSKIENSDTKDSLEIEKKILTISKDLLKLKGDTLKSKLREFDENLDNLKETFYNKTPFSTKRFYWLSLFGKVNGTEYRIYDDSKPFSDRIFNKQLSTNSLGVSFNTYATSKVSWLYNYYLSVGYSKSNENNVSGLDPVDIISEEISLSKDSVVARTLKQSTNAFRGKVLMSKFDNWDVQFLKFLTKDKSFALNFSYQYKRDLETEKTFKNLGVGLMVVAKDPKVEKQKYNVEFYVKFKDLDNTRGNTETKKWSQRNEIGVRLGLPFGLVK